MDKYRSGPFEFHPELWGFEDAGDEEGCTISDYSSDGEDDNDIHADWESVSILFSLVTTCYILNFLLGWPSPHSGNYRRHQQTADPAPPLHLRLFQLLRRDDVRSKCPPYSGQNRYFRDPVLVNQLVRDQEYRDSEFRMEEYRRPYGQRLRRALPLSRPTCCGCGGSSYDGRPHEHFEHFEYDDPRQSVRFEGLRYDDRYEGSRYYQDREFREGPSGSGYADDELYEREAPRRRENRVDQKKRKRREKEEEEKEEEMS